MFVYYFALAPGMRKGGKRANKMQLRNFCVGSRAAYNDFDSSIFKWLLLQNDWGSVEKLILPDCFSQDESFDI